MSNIDKIHVVMNNKKQDVVKSNALIEAAYAPGSVYKMRLLMAALMQIKGKEKMDTLKPIRVTANALSDLTGQKAIANYRELKSAAQELRGMHVTVYEKANTGEPIVAEINLISSCRYIKSQGCVDVIFGLEATPFISELRRKFTKYQAKYVMHMRSGYGIRLYELCLQWMGDEREFTIEDFRTLFVLNGKSFERIEVIKRRVITPALDDINTHSDIRVSFGQRKAGRKVTHFQFRITRSAKASKVLKIDKWMNEYNVGHGERNPSKKTLEKYAEYKKDPDAWISKEVKNG